VNIAARIAARAASDEVLVWSTVKDLVVESDIAFTERGARSMAFLASGLFAVENPGEP
jgi:hypothetical protein